MTTVFLSNTCNTFVRKHTVLPMFSLDVFTPQTLSHYLEVVSRLSVLYLNIVLLYRIHIDMLDIV